jgi:hypothetical protein
LESAAHGFTKAMADKLPSLQQGASPRSVTTGQAIRNNSRIGRLRVDFRLQNLAATVKPGRADVVAQMRFAGGRLDRSTRDIQGIVRAMHAALGGRLLVLLNGHEILLNSLD